jgi:hypothetical protein
VSIPEIYITNGIHFDSHGGKIPAEIITQLHQFQELNIRIPRKGYRTASMKLNLLSSELAPIYRFNKFTVYSCFLYVKWRGRVVFWGPVLIKEMDFEDNSLVVQASDQGSRLEHHYFRIGDEALNIPDDGTGIPKGYLGVGIDGLILCIKAGEYTDSNSQPYGRAIPLGIKIGTNSHVAGNNRIIVERAQEVWRTMMDLGERTDGPLFDLVPMTIEDGKWFATMNVYGRSRTDRSKTVKFHYGTGLKNVRNISPTVGGQVLSHVHVVTQNNHWRTTTASGASIRDYGVWVQWEQVDFNIADSETEAQVNKQLGAVGDTILDSYGRPLISLEVQLRRDDEINPYGGPLAHQFYWLDDFQVSDIVEIAGVKGYEQFKGKYRIDEVRLEQEGDASGQVRQVVDVSPWVTTDQYKYVHNTDFIQEGVADQDS